SSEQIKIGADPAIACITLFDTAIEERTALILLVGSTFPLLNRKLRPRVTFHPARLSSNAVILWRWVSRCQRGGADVLRLRDGFFGRPPRRGIDRHFTTDRIPLVIRAGLITVRRATANQIRPDRNVRLLVRPHLAISLFELLNQLLLALGLIAEPVQMLYTDVSMLVGMTYVYLPFMVLPLYANLVKLDYGLLEAAYDLGATPWKAFWLVTVPLSRAGIIAGFMLVFIPALGEFVIPSLLGGPENLMIGRVVWDEMFTANNWPRASALAVVMIAAIVVPLALYYRRHGQQADGRH
ncbi:MAG: hypothetical protein RIS48_544, partial [Pseudomonadota bacterium]